MKTKLYCSIPAPRTKAYLRLLTAAALLATLSAMRAASPSELLEQGIYQEETKGDLDAALKCYRQAVAEAKTGWAAAAQAQFRLGVCYYKKRDSTAALAAFEQLVKEHPEQKELAIQAADYQYRALPLLPAPWVDGEQLRFDAKVIGADPKLGSFTLNVNAAETNGQRRWVLEADASGFFAGLRADRATVDAATFRPFNAHSRVTTSGEIEGDTLYHPGGAEVWVNGAASARKIEWAGAVYDEATELVPYQLLRRLPLTTNYSLTLMASRMSSTNGDRFVTPLKLRVAGIESVRVPFGTYECFKVELSTNGVVWNDTVWYSTDAHRYPVKLKTHVERFDVAAELAALNRQQPGEPARYRDPALGFSLTAPPGWLFDRYTGDESTAAVAVLKRFGEVDDHSARFLNSFWENPMAESAICIVHPDLAGCRVSVGPLAKLSDAARKSPQAWAVEDAARTTNNIWGMSLVRNEWRECTIAGRPAMSAAIGDFPLNAANVSSTLYGIWTFSGTNAVKFYLLSSSKDFARLRPAFDEVVQSYTPSP